MNKKAEFDWSFFGLLLMVIIICIGIVYSCYTTEQKYTELCERKGMSYFDTKAANQFANSPSIVICLDEYGDQHEVVLK